jgi:hypothetical protein
VAAETKEEHQAMKFWDPNMPKRSQILWGALAFVLLFYGLTLVRLPPPIHSWEQVGKAKAEYVIHAEQFLKNYKTGVFVRPTHDWTGMIADLELAFFNKKEEDVFNFIGLNANNPGPIAEFIKAFAEKNFRYSQNLCEMASKKFPSARVEYVILNYYASVRNLETGKAQKNFFFSETSDCELPPKVDLLTYLQILVS